MANEPVQNPFLRPSLDGRASISAASKHSSSSMLPLVYTQGLLTPRRNAYSIGLLVASIYSTLLSGLFFVVALLQPKYGHIVSARGRFSPSSAALLTAFIAKTVELTFVMVSLAFIGQVLSRRAVQQKGISLASVSMRTWILQPGSLLSQFNTFRFAGLSVLGILSFVIAILSLLYTTAAGALVQPQLRLPPWEHTVLAGEVAGDFSSTLKANETCLTEWPDVGDTQWGGSTCLAVKWSSLCGRNFVRYMSAWDDNAVRQDRPPWMSENITERLPIGAALDNNITVTTTWLDNHDIEADSKKAGRIINNITIAVPHRGVPSAARNTQNDLLQPEDLHNGGSYSIHASVASFALNVLCVNAKEDELAPIIYETWPNRIPMDDRSKAVNWWPVLGFPEGTNTNNKTVLDDIFGWKDEDVNHSRARPIFLKYPKAANTIANHTQVPYELGDRPEVYILGKAPDNTTSDYFLCSMKAGITTSCTTHYNASSNGQSLEAVCDSENGTRSKDATIAPIRSNGDRLALIGWRDLGYYLLNSLSLNNGVFDGDASTARILTQLQLTEPKLNKTLPSPAEALLSMMTCTVLDLTQNFPFQPLWAEPPGPGKKFQHFNASVRVAQYMSGGENAYQKALLVVLCLTLLINLFIFVYLSFSLRVRLITDLCEPLVLFILGYHSPPSEGLFKGLPQEGPQKSDLSVDWIVKRKDDQLVVVGKGEADDAGEGGSGGVGEWFRLRRRGGGQELLGERSGADAERERGRETG
ncbi:hypothetical protein P3342_007248 [Pyrenophora teres f. teres]|uniref:DUF3176 domain containing protein n=1 Tax=Pyrenophora teres f. teres TaxID=97479 RepID=A0A6S6W1M5_9PLEO|nr:hypothetical protein P3342_007248 [Pyrenophora teres f. teres]CAE7034196.1 hypothetical protein PTTW11_05364 [Pyrenophora teres f. teres]